MRSITRDTCGPQRCQHGRPGPWPGTVLRRQLAAGLKATEDGRGPDQTLSTLDSLLGASSESDEGQRSAGRDPNMVEWWRVRPRQAAPPRTTSISSSANPSGRFIANEEMLRNEVWAGRKTLPGQALELPKVAPLESYALAVVNAAVYGTLVRVYATQGAEAAAELLSGLGLSREAVVQQAEVWRLLTGCFAQADLPSLAVVLYGLLVVAPRVEASLGYRTFTAAFFLSAVAAADAFILTSSGGAGHASAALLLPGSQALTLSDPALLCGGLGTMMGLAGSAVAHELMNGDVERQASGAAASSSGGSAADAASRMQSVRVDVRTVGLMVGAAGVVLLHALEPGGPSLLAALGAGFGTGFLLSSIAGPRYQVTREVELPDGSMWIPDFEAVEEMTVVLDQTTSIQRTLGTAAVTALISIATVTIVLGQ